MSHPDKFAAEYQTPKPHRPDFTDADLDGGKYRPLWEGESSKQSDPPDEVLRNDGRWEPFIGYVSEAGKWHVKLRRRVEKPTRIGHLPAHIVSTEDMPNVTDLFAMAAMQAIIAQGTQDPASVALSSYVYARAMLAERAKKPVVNPDH